MTTQHRTCGEYMLSLIGPHLCYHTLIHTFSLSLTHTHAHRHTQREREREREIRV